jgi:hypothetical protein
VKGQHIAQTDLLKTELVIKKKINDKLNEANQKLLGELAESKKIIGSNRLHFKELEKADFATLQQKNQDYSFFLTENSVDQNKLDKFSLQRIQKKLDQN